MLENKDQREINIGNGAAPDEIEIELPADPKCFSIMVGINGHPMKGDIKCDTDFTDWDLLRAAWRIEAAVLEALYERGLSHKQVMEHCMHVNYFRREYLGEVMNLVSEGNEEVVRAIMDADLLESYAEFKENEGKKVHEEVEQEKKNLYKFVVPEDEE